MLRDDICPPDNVIRLAERRVRVHTTAATSDPDCELTGDVDADGLVLRDVGDMALGRYIWVDFDLDGEGEPVRALGEVLPRRDSMGLALDIKFKHLFPDHKRRLLQALGNTRRG